MLNDPRSGGLRPPFPKQQQAAPGKTAKVDPTPDHGEETYVGHAKLKPAEVAPAYVYLTSDDASYVVGAVLPVTGGKIM